LERQLLAEMLLYAGVGLPVKLRLENPDSHIRELLLKLPNALRKALFVWRHSWHVSLSFLFV
jgi:hypothetical protein